MEVATTLDGDASLTLLRTAVGQCDCQWLPSCPVRHSGRTNINLDSSAHTMWACAMTHVAHSTAPSCNLRLGPPPSVPGSFLRRVGFVGADVRRRPEVVHRPPRTAIARARRAPTRGGISRVCITYRTLAAGRRGPVRNAVHVPRDTRLILRNYHGVCA